MSAEVRLLDVTYDEAKVMADSLLSRIQKSKNSLKELRSLISLYDKLIRFIEADFKKKVEEEEKINIPF